MFFHANTIKKGQKNAKLWRTYQTPFFHAKQTMTYIPNTIFSSEFGLNNANLAWQPWTRRSRMLEWSCAFFLKILSLGVVTFWKLDHTIVRVVMQAHQGGSRCFSIGGNTAVCPVRLISSLATWLGERFADKRLPVLSHWNNVFCRAVVNF